jgi:hypothetical protein
VAFTLLFKEFFKAIEMATGRPLRFKAFDVDGNIYSIIFDMEAAQVQGLGDALLAMPKPSLQLDGPDRLDPNILLGYVLKLCSVHLKRYCFQTNKFNHY